MGRKSIEWVKLMDSGSDEQLGLLGKVPRGREGGVPILECY